MCSGLFYIPFFYDFFKKLLTKNLGCGNIYEWFKWPVGQAVKTPPSHGGDKGSIPLRVSVRKWLRIKDSESFFYFEFYLKMYFDWFLTNFLLNIMEHYWHLNEWNTVFSTITKQVTDNRQPLALLAIFTSYKIMHHDTENHNMENRIIYREHSTYSSTLHFFIYDTYDFLPNQKIISF